MRRKTRNRPRQSSCVDTCVAASNVWEKDPEASSLYREKEREREKEIRAKLDWLSAVQNTRGSLSFRGFDMCEFRFDVRKSGGDSDRSSTDDLGRLG